MSHRRCIRAYLESLESRVYGDSRQVGQQASNETPGQDMTSAMTPDSTSHSFQFSGTGMGVSRSGEGTPITQRWMNDSETRHAQDADQEDPSEVNSPEFQRNPLVDNGEVFARDPGGKFWYMGPTSSWAFCRRVLALIGNSMPNPELPVYPWDLETVNITWEPIGLHRQPDVTGLPPQEYALYLMSIVQYRLGSLAQLIDPESFPRSIELFYESPAAVARRSRFWFSQFLLVLAFGEAFLNNGGSKGTPGTEYASRALSLIPSLIPMNGDKDPLAAVQAHCLAALYLQAIDLRLMAYQIIGQGLRLAIIEGWHRHMPPEDVGNEHSKRCNTIFWISYIIDQEFGPLVGGVSSIRTEDITAKLPSEIDGSVRATTLTLQIRLSQLTAKILASVYGVDKSFDGSLVSDTQSVLHSLADVSKDISAFLETRLNGTNLRSSQMVTRLILSYHHCIVLTTRPLVMCVLQRRAAQRSRDRTVPNGPISSLLQSCVHSALSILKTLQALGDSNLLESFLPFQMETVFSSAFLLYIMNTVSPGSVPNQTWLAMAHDILDIMIAKGSPAAPLRKRELQRLEQVMTSYVQTESITDSSALYLQEEVSLSKAEEDMTQTDEATYVDNDLPWDFLGTSGGLIMSPAEILQLAEGIHLEDFTVNP